MHNNSIQIRANVVQRHKDTVICLSGPNSSSSESAATAPAALQVGTWIIISNVGRCLDVSINSHIEETAAGARIAN